MYYMIHHAAIWGALLSAASCLCRLIGKLIAANPADVAEPTI